MPPNTEDTKVDDELSRITLEELDLKKLVRERGFYGVHPDVYYPPLEPFEHKDPGHLADPTKAALLNAATKVIDVTPNIGTEIHGIQLSQLSEQQKNDLALLVAERGVVFFRSQDLTAKQALEFGRHFGPLHVHNVGPHPPNAPEILTIQVDHENPKVRERYALRSAGDGWHNDISYELQPAGLTFLKIDTLPKVGGDTLWASAYTAYDRLSPAWQKFVEGLEAVHSGDVHRETARITGYPLRREAPDNVHPIVRTHPLTGWKSLYVQRGFTRRIVGFTKRESDAVLEFLFNHIESGHDFQVRFRWQEDSIAVWDNRATYHTAINDYFGNGIRHGFRVTPTAERPYFDPNSKSRQQVLDEKASVAKKD
ncbi:hypothetical protein O0I10_004060 [Lichtheimia ornata]|uniref:TauD/TfdA-like domain-containing protein n=1 Tax=Lichtheimia ornata TaxID=688661 RepID=A0AAD7Y0M8_9FUNG|nr:uncharacterized protein O0I10_004060 [Lichtheimia ornata]KAJ8660201.1 hypothetical protein O0I10_004060 [Lichtheimia ornata]